MPAAQIHLFTDIDDSAAVLEAVHQLATEGTLEERGAIATRPEVVEFLLDLCGYTADKPLYGLRLLEPSFGHGDFLVPAIRRLLDSWRESQTELETLASSITAVELHMDTFESTYNRVTKLLRQENLTAQQAHHLADSWLHCGDFLLRHANHDFDLVIGNPPYVRQERIPAILLAEYRRRFATLYDRADLYVPFIEHSLACLAEGGRLGFICAARWTQNKYGAPLRQLIARRFHLEYFIDMSRVSAFQKEVNAYAAITVLTTANGHKATRVVQHPDMDPNALRALSAELQAKLVREKSLVEERSDIARGSAPWHFQDAAAVELLKRLEARFPLLEASGCTVGIGVATGADRVFTGLLSDLDVEDSCKLPLVMTRDLTGGAIQWRGKGVINPFNDDGTLVDLRQFPRLQHYFAQHRETLLGRHVAQSRPNSWYRTIDRITPSLLTRPKLLIADINGFLQPVYDEGRYYPHHNLYYILSSEWDLRLLGPVLASGIGQFFVAHYATSMRGGYLRFQAQYLRRIRLPKWSSLSKEQQLTLQEVGSSGDIKELQQAIWSIYELTSQDISIIQPFIPKWP